MNNNTPSTLSLSLTVPDTAEALEFYKKALGVQELFRMAAPDGTVMHAEFMLGNSHLYVSCGSPEWKAAAMPEGASAPCLFGVDSEDPAASYATAIAAGCTSIEEPKDQFWGVRTSLVQDPFGYRWNFRKVLEELSPEEVEKRAAALFSGDC